MKAYLEIIREVYENGSETPQRAVVNGEAVNQLVLPGMVFRHDLSKGFPLLTTKRVPLLKVTAENEMFIKGITRKEFLHARGDCRIWDPWQMPGQDDSGELGPIYGFQWRRYGAYEHVGEVCLEKADGSGFEEDRTLMYKRTEIDQLKNLIDGLISNPWDRRSVVTAWNPGENHLMALPPCHMMFQTITTLKGGKKVLNLSMTMRSADLMIGVPFNIASYGVLLLLIAKHVGMEPGTLITTMNNAHIYCNHLDAVKEQLSRMPGILPEVKIPDRMDGKPFNIFEWEYDQIEITGYNPEKTIKMDVAV